MILGDKGFIKKVRFLEVTSERPEPTAPPKSQQESRQASRPVNHSINSAKLMSPHARHRSTIECDQRSKFKAQCQSLTSVRSLNHTTKPNRRTRLTSAQFSSELTELLR
ncbi:hypothetical protein T265_01674 [Opisthorchis viverrini]|uniref:Uncharacterized protein n=1 Tax=Opisthorchis viverrini TaxID=6198 RepID=A0A075A1X9_OPIVI|nr:hypothetical protein T265_01674 [Opisthorchis viverrini]KER32242.1 hypothetical protein T265_01674 [Opisthorchis viverrini]